MSSSLTRSLNLNFQKSDSIIYPRTFKNNNFYLNKLSYVKVEEYNRTSGEGPLIIGEFRQDILTVDFMKAINCEKNSDFEFSWYVEEFQAIPVSRYSICRWSCGFWEVWTWEYIGII